MERIAAEINPFARGGTPFVAFRRGGRGRLLRPARASPGGYRRPKRCPASSMASNSASNCAAVVQ